jgi:proteasome lid subunit RPN8/RPN11
LFYPHLNLAFGGFLLTIPKIRKIILKNEHLRMMLKEAYKEYPKEACGVILGQIKLGTVKAQELVFTKNVAGSSARFMIDAEELYRILVRAEEEGKEMVGIFHSHPTVAKPSGIDQPFMEVNPIVWVIVGTLNDRIDIAAYQWFKESIHPVEIVVKDV